MLFGQKTNKTQQQNSKQKSLSEPGIEPKTSRTTVGSVISRPLSQLNISIEGQAF